MERKLALLALAGTLAVGGCGVASGFPSNVALVVENRTNSNLALTSELRVAPCAEATFTADDVLKAHQGQRIVAFLGPDDAANGLVAVTIPDDVSQKAATSGPVIAVVTSAGTSFSTSLDRSTLPSCSGTAPSS